MEMILCHKALAGNRESEKEEEQHSIIIVAPTSHVVTCHGLKFSDLHLISNFQAVF